MSNPLRTEPAIISGALVAVLNALVVTPADLWHPHFGGGKGHGGRGGNCASDSSSSSGSTSTGTV